MRKLYILSVLFLLHSASLIAQIPTDSLYLYLPFSNNKTDQSGKNQTIATYGNPSFVSDRFGKVLSALSVDGIDDYLTVVEDFDWADKTVNLWFSADTITSTNKCIFSIDHPGLTNGLVVFNVRTSGVKSVEFSRGSSSHNLLVPASEKTWHMVTIAVEGDSNFYYYDGVLKGKTKGNAKSVDGTNKTVIGNNRGFNSPFPGKIDDVRIYKRKLSATEVLALYNEQPATNIEQLAVHAERFALITFPNPAADWVLAEWPAELNPETAVIRITDLTGKSIAAQYNISEGMLKIDCSSMSGIYQLRIGDSSNDKVFLSRITVQ